MIRHDIDLTPTKAVSRVSLSPISKEIVCILCVEVVSNPKLFFLASISHKHVILKILVGTKLDKGNCVSPLPSITSGRLSQSPFSWESSQAENGLFSPASAPIFTDQILGRRCDRGCGSNDLQSESLKLNDIIFYETQSSYLLATLRVRSRSQINKLDFADIGENQSKVVEAYLNGRVVLTISSTGSGIILTFGRTFVVDFFKHGERDDIEQFAW